MNDKEVLRRVFAYLGPDGPVSLQDKVYDMLLLNEEVTTRQVADELDITERKSQRYLNSPGITRVQGSAVGAYRLCECASDSDIDDCSCGEGGYYR